jgi:predicted amidohydrolase
MWASVVFATYVLELALLTAAATPSGVRVAAVHYPTSRASRVDQRCADDDHLCGVSALVARAARAGAALVVVPEYAVPQLRAAPDPALGELQADDAPLLEGYQRLAREHGVYLVVQLVTMRGLDRFNTQVAFAPDGRVAGRHHKFELYGAEKQRFRKGDGVTVVETPFGRVGLLVCADLYGDPRLHETLTGSLGADIVAVSSMWTVEGANAWPRAFAVDWNVHVVAANSADGEGRGSGIFAPSGRTLAATTSTTGTVIVTDVRLSR